MTTTPPTGSTGTASTNPMLRLHPANAAARAAYGARVAGGTDPSRAAPATTIGRIGEHTPARPEPVAVLPSTPTDHRDRLTGAGVSAPIDFDAEAANPSTPSASTPSGAYAMYRHPADKVAAATGLSAGRVGELGDSIDVSG